MQQYRADAKQRAEALSGEREKQEAAMKAKLAARRRKKQALLSKRLAEERNKISADTAAKSAEVTSSVAANMQRTMSALAQRAVRRSMASMANMKRGKQAQAEAPAAASTSAKASTGAGGVPSRLAASAAAFKQGGADLSALATRVQQIEDAFKAVLSKSAAVQGTAMSSTQAAAPPSARSEVDDASAAQGMLALAASSIDRPVAGSGPQPQDGKLTPVQEANLPHRRRVRLRYARAIATAVGMMGPKATAPVRLEAASALPKPAPAEKCFRDVIYAEAAQGQTVLYLRVELLDQTAELFSVLNHALAVYKETGAFSDRTAPAVLATLNKNFMVCGQELYRSVAATSAAESTQAAPVRGGGAESLARKPMRRLGSAIVPSMASRMGSGRDLTSLGSQFGGFKSSMGSSRASAAPSLTKRNSFHG